MKHNRLVVSMERFQIERYDSIEAAAEVLRAFPSPSFSYQRCSVLCALERSLKRTVRLHAMAYWGHRGRTACTGARFRVYVVRDEQNRLVCAAPLQGMGEQSWTVVVGKYIFLDTTDFLYADRPQADLIQAFELVMSRLAADGVRHLTWFYLPESSPVATWLTDSGVVPTAEIPNVCISFPEGDAKAYWSCLSRNARQNLKTAANRMAREGVSARFEFYSACGLGLPLDTSAGRRVLRRCRSVYVRHQAVRYGHDRRGVGFFFRHATYVSLSIPGCNGFLCVLWIGDRIGAYMEGYVNERRQALEVPRLGMDDELARFRPGRSMLKACVEWLAAQSRICRIDLGRGAERYKYDMGGSTYLTYTISFNPSFCREQTEGGRS